MQQANVKYPILDAPLTELGRSQTVALGQALKREAAAGMPVPEQWFSSPMRRSAETAAISWGWLFGDDGEVLSETTQGARSHGVPALVIEVGSFTLNCRYMGG